MRFRLSSFLLMIAIVALMTAWYIDHHRQRSDDIVGVWYYPTPDHIFRKYQETLTLRADGTFTLEQWIANYTGTYTLAGNGIVLFHVATKQQVLASAPSETYSVDRTYRCRIARDSYSNLLVIDLEPGMGSPDSDMGPLGEVRIVWPETVDISWHCYTSMSHDAQNAQRDAMWKKWEEEMSTKDRTP